MKLHIDASFDVAIARAVAGEDPAEYMLAYAAGRNRAEQGCDAEADWLLLKSNPMTSAARLAGFIEGLASTRDPAQWGGAR
ncbi:hypothetical protein [Streptomyces sp. NPDC048196]|uniref:hypothetical protein n=1 Tax=Streptomyces sp. NPDC048196 TaxID=3154712 RepID=UPI0033E5843C